MSVQQLLDPNSELESLFNIYANTINCQTLNADSIVTPTIMADDIETKTLEVTSTATIASTNTTDLKVTNAANLNGGIILPTTGGTPTTLTNYTEFTHATNWSGPIASTSSPIQVTVIGRMVFLRFTGFNTAGNNVGASLVSSAALPSWLWPTTTSVNSAIVVASGSTTLGNVRVNTNGIINWYNGQFTTNFGPAVSQMGFNTTCICYPLGV